MRLSKQLFSTNVADQWTGIYSPFGHHVAFLPQDDWENLKNGHFGKIDLELLDFLKESNILVEEDFEKEWLKKINCSTSVAFNWMYLVLTTECNLACKYCAVLGNENEGTEYQKQMSLEVGNAAVEFYERHLCQTQPGVARVTLYGGEPLLRKDLLFELIPKLRRIRYPNMAYPMEICIITNGYLYDPDVTELFKEYSVDLAVSIDGMKEHHDAARVTKDGSGTFETVLINYHKYLDEGLAVNISSTIGKHNIYDLPEIARYFAENLHAKLVEFQIPCEIPGSNPLLVSTTEASKYLMKADDILRSYKVYEGTNLRRLNDFAKGRVRVRDCKSSGSQLVVAPDGMLGPCHSLVASRKYFAGNIVDPTCDITRLENFKEWARRFPLNMESCQGCHFITLCGGGCIYNSYTVKGSIWNKDPHTCAYMAILLQWVLLDLWKRTGMSDEYGAIAL